MISQTRRTHLTKRGAVVFLILVTSVTVNPARSSFAAPLELGDIVVVQQGVNDVYVIDPQTGRDTPVAKGVPGSLSHVIIDDGGLIVTSTRGSTGVVQVDPESGAYQSVIQGDPITRPASVAIDRDGNLVVADVHVGVFRVDLETHEFQLLTNEAPIQDIEVGPNNTIYLLDSNGVGPGRILSINSGTGQLTTVSEGGLIDEPVDMELDPGGNLYVSNARSNSSSDVLRIDVESGQQERLFTYGSPGFIALENPNHLLIGDFFNNEILRANIHTGEITLLADLGLGGNITGIAVVVPEPDTAVLLGFAAVGFLASKRRPGS